MSSSLEPIRRFEVKEDERKKNQLLFARLLIVCGRCGCVLQG